MIEPNRFDWKWYLKDLPKPKEDAPTVFSCFSCGGGSCMGYEKTGFRLLGNCEIDPKVNEVYKKNLHPKYNYLMDIRDFNKLAELPDELYNLDILDGSPPCTVFSTAGKREADWGVEKQFREGQAKQTLDDLFFVFIETVEKLRPKVVVAENVTGLIKGNARYYVSMIISRFKDAGYDVQLFKLNSMYMDVPQKRERVFFIANRCGFPKLKLQFNHRQITFGEVRAENGRPLKQSDDYRTAYQLLKHKIPSDNDLGDINKRLYGKEKCFNQKILKDGEPSKTITANGSFYRWVDDCYATEQDFSNVSSFPQDYDFSPMDAQYITGMSVPPNMMANIATEIREQWFTKGGD